MPSSTDGTEAPRRVKRAKTGCLTCRARKVKCDETPGTCNNCYKMQVGCDWADSIARPSAVPASETSPIAPRLPIRRPSACYSCRYARTRCSQGDPTCARCASQSLSCAYPAPGYRHSLTPAALSWVQKHRPSTGTPSQGQREASTTGRHQSLSSHDETGTTELLDSAEQQGQPVGTNVEAPEDYLKPERAQSERLVAAFFNHVHVYQANAYLHRDSTLFAVRDGKMCPTVLLALCAVSARFVRPPEDPSSAARWAEEAGKRLVTSTGVSRENVITALLLATFAQQSGLFTQSHRWSALANREALSLGLHREGSSSASRSWMAAEGDRRLYHACYALERAISDGTPESVFCPAERISLRLPCEGFNYRMGIITETPRAILEGDETEIPPWLYNNVGAMGVYLRLVGCRFIIRKCTHELSHLKADTLPTHTAPWESDSPFAACMTKLAAIKNSLPPRMRLTREVILTRYDSPGLAPLVMIYLWWNMAHVELCRMVLPGYAQSLDPALLSLAPAGWSEQTRQTCLRHARAITAILDLVARTMPRDPLVIYDHTFPRIVYSSIRVQIEFAELQVMDDLARQELRVSFDMMLEFVSRTSLYFRTAQLLLRETKRMMARHGMAPLDDTVEPAETPPYPWFRKQKSIDDERQSVPSTTPWSKSDCDLLDGLFAGLLPDHPVSGMASWTGEAEVALWPDPNSQMFFGPPQWDSSAARFPSLSNDGNAVAISGSGFNLSDATERWKGKTIEWQGLMSDPLLPGLGSPGLVFTQTGSESQSQLEAINSWLAMNDGEEY